MERPRRACTSVPVKFETKVQDDDEPEDENMTLVEKVRIRRGKRKRAPAGLRAAKLVNGKSAYTYTKGYYVVQGNSHVYCKTSGTSATNF